MRAYPDRSTNEDLAPRHPRRPEVGGLEEPEQTGRVPNTEPGVKGGRTNPDRSRLARLKRKLTNQGEDLGKILWRMRAEFAGQSLHPQHHKRPPFLKARLLNEWLFKLSHAADNGNWPNGREDDIPLEPYRDLCHLLGEVRGRDQAPCRAPRWAYGNPRYL